MDRPSAGARAIARVLEGPHVWGEFEVWTSRYGYTSHCLVVYPPGSSRSDRVRFRALRVWPPIGMLLGVLAVIVAGQTLPLAGALLVGALVYATGAFCLALLAGPRRRRIRTLQTCRGDEGTGAFDRGPEHALDEFSGRLLEAEKSRRDGLIDAVGFEAVWGAVWSELGDATPRRP